MQGGGILVRAQTYDPCRSRMEFLVLCIVHILAVGDRTAPISLDQVGVQESHHGTHTFLSFSTRDASL
jgi:hypothetical protein